MQIQPNSAVFVILQNSCDFSATVPQGNCDFAIAVINMRACSFAKSPQLFRMIVQVQVYCRSNSTQRG